ncbi:hypothetical protein F383_26035 [Gossypium arboreum]|uniref:Uncharacterized protein n=1 Tax=Gossypium arboreum TaxID=29729 RepID=A0A0B0P5R3_GOSAR|nr:hypothetical protein F383_26035 [Gossypium arboreum]
MSNTQEISYTMCHISINGPAYTTSQLRRSYMVLFTQAIK